MYSVDAEDTNQKADCDDTVQEYIPFTHTSIHNPIGLFRVIDSRKKRSLHYFCVSCNVQCPFESKFIRHCLTQAHVRRLREKCNLPPSKNEGPVEEIDSQSYLFTFEDNSPSPLYDAFLSATVESFSVADDVTELSEGASSNVFKVGEDNIAKWYIVSSGKRLVVEKNKETLYNLQPIILAPAIHLRPSEMIENVYCKICYNYCE